MRVRRSLLRVSVVSAALSGLAPMANAACSVSSTGTVNCDHNTTTRTSTNKNGHRTRSRSRIQQFTNGSAISASVAPGVKIDGAGLELVQGSGRRAKPRPISLRNFGSIISDLGSRKDTTVLTGNGGPITYTGAGTIAGKKGDGLSVKNSGDITLIADGAIAGGVPTLVRDKRGRLATPSGIEALETGAGNIVVGGSGTVQAPGGRSIKVKQGPTGTGSILVTGTGDTASFGTICPGVNVQRALAKGQTGCSGIRATIKNTANTKDIVIDRSGNISGTSTAINALTIGKGDIVVTTGRNAQISGAADFAIEASSKGSHSSGSIAIATGANSRTTTGGTGVFAVSLATHVPSRAGSAIDIKSNGTIESGSFAAAALDTLQNPIGVLAGVSAGYAGGKSTKRNSHVHGSVSVENTATITAHSGAGILAYNFGQGPVSVVTTAPVTAEAGNGIYVPTAHGPVTIAIGGPAALVTGTGVGQAALSIAAMSAAAQIEVASGAMLRGVGGAVGLAASGKASGRIFNAGTIVGSVGISGSGISLFNTGIVSGRDPGNGGRTPAIVLTGGQNSVAGPGLIDGGIDVRSTATFMPALSGTGIGTPLALGGSLGFASTATYRVRLSAAAADSVTVDGVASLGNAGVRVEAAASPPTPGSAFTILRATGGVAGRFSATKSDLAFFRPSLTYGSNDVVLTARYKYALNGSTQNEASVSAGLDAAAGVYGAGAYGLSALNRTTTARGRAVLDSLSGEGLTGARTTALRATELFSTSIFDRLTLHGSGDSLTFTGPTALLALAPADAAAAGEAGAVRRPAADAWHVWTTGFGSAQEIGGHTSQVGSAAQSNTVYGSVVGADYRVSPNYLVGAALGGSSGAFQVDTRATSGSVLGGNFALYQIATLGTFYGASSGSVSYYGNRTTRSAVGPGNETERGSFGSSVLQGRVEFGQHIATFGGSLTPFVAIEVAALQSDGFRENAISGPGTFRLAVPGQSTTSLPGSIGARFQRDADLGGGMILSPFLQAAYVHEFMPDRRQIGSLVNLPAATFLVDGARPGRSAVQTKVGGELALSARASIFANFDGLFSNVDRSYGGKGGFVYRW